MNQNSSRHSISSFFTFLLLLVFMLFTLMLTGTGAAIYKNSSAHLEENYTSRTAVSYVTEKIRQHDQNGCIFLTEVEQLPALALSDTIQGEDYITYIYFYDQSLCELFIRKEQTPSAALGNRLTALSSFSIEQTKPQLFTIHACSLNGKELSASVYSRTGNK